MAPRFSGPAVAQGSNGLGQARTLELGKPARL